MKKSVTKSSGKSKRAKSVPKQDESLLYLNDEPETPDQLSPKSQGSHRSSFSYGQGSESVIGNKLKKKANQVRRQSAVM